MRKTLWINFIGYLRQYFKEKVACYIHFYKYVEFQSKKIFQADGIRETKALRYLKYMGIAS